MKAKQDMDKIKLINSISEYIETVNEYIRKNKKPNRIFLYRGENRNNSNSCMPNLFRKKFI